MYPTVGNFHLEILQFLYDNPSALDKTQFNEITELASAGLKDDMKLLTDQRADFRKNLEKAEELRKRVELCPMCGTYLNSVPEKMAEEPKKEYGPDGLEIDHQDIPVTADEFAPGPKEVVGEKESVVPFMPDSDYSAKKDSGK